MRIIYLHQYFCTPAAPGGTRSFEFARRLVERGHSVDVLTTRPPAAAGPDTPPGSWAITQEAGVTVHWCTVDYANSMSYRARIRAFAEYAVRAAWRIRSMPRDLVFATSTPLTVAVPAVLGSRRVPMVFEVRDVWPEVPIALGALRNPWARRAAYGLEAWAYKHARHVVALSPDMAASITRRHPSTAVTVVPNASDRDRFDVTPDVAAEFRRGRPWLGSGPLIVYAGTFGLVNGLSYLVRMASAMREIDPAVRFLLVGEGREEEDIRALARELGVLDDNLFIEPPMPKQDLPALLAASDLCTSTVIDVPELAANSANKAFDAFAAGRPLLINHEGWLAETLRASGAGVVAPANDPAEAARSTAARLRDTSWTRRARSAAQALAEDSFDRDLLFERLDDVLCSAAGLPRPSSSDGRVVA